ncbi:MAG TPA: hypothetical protein PK245_04465, partial [Clostridia bacterium]|nr:hypothetical protein [Clostridia bacterium]
MKTNAFLKSVSTAPISAKWRIFFAISLIIIVAGLATFFIVGGVKGDLSEGVNAGIDFQGGTILSV